MSVDKHPQWFKMEIQGSAVADYFQDIFETPVQLIGGGNSILAMNVLKILVRVNIQDDQFVTAKRTGITYQLTPEEETALLSGDNDRLIYQDVMDVVYKLTTSGAAAIQNNARMIDVSNGKGDGILITDKSIHLGGKADADNTSNHTVTMWLLYNLVNVSAKEKLLEAFLQS